MNRVLKWIIAFALGLGVVLPNSVTADAATKKYSATVTVKNLNAREKPSSKSKKVGTLKKGTKVTVYSKTKSGWSEIRYKKKKAYVSTKYLKISKPAVKVTKHKYKKISDLTYPQVKGLRSKSAEKKINSTLLNHTKESYKDYVSVQKDKKELQKEDFCEGNPYYCNLEYHLFYKVKYNQGNKLSILYTDYYYEGGVHGLHYVSSYNFNLKNGKRVKLNDILNSKTKRSKVKKYAYNYMKKNQQTFFDIELKDVVINNNTQFYYTDGGIYLIFQIYEVAPYSSGNPTVKIPASVYK